MASTALAGSWEGVESLEDGVLHIRNTETPQTVPGNFTLTELWRRGGEDNDLIFGITGRIIEKEYKPLTRTREDHDRLSRTSTMWINGHEASFKTQKYSRTVRDVFPRPDGSLWVLSDRGSRVRADGLMAQFDEFDAQGRFVREVNLSGDADLFEDGFYINDDLVYVVKGLTAAKASLHAAEDVQEAEADPLMVVCYRLTLVK